MVRFSLATPRRTWSLGLWVLVIVGLCSMLLFSAPVPDADAQTQTVEQVNDRLGVGINLGNALEAPREGDWGVTLREDYFSTIAEAGFGHVRVPIRFSAYTGEAPLYLIPTGIDSTVPHANTLWDRIDWIIQNAEDNGLYVILDLHLYEEIQDDVEGERARFLAIWKQVSERYADAGPSVLFELLNEPKGQFNDDPTLLNTLIVDALNIIRVTNPTRPVLVGPTYWNQIGALGALELPNDPNLIVSVHFYDPLPFTHQGASWIDPVPPAPLGFDADSIGYGAGWGDWSWSSSAVPSSNSLAVTFDHRWGGVAFGRLRATSFEPETLKVEVSGTSELSVRCADTNDINTEVTRINTTAAATTFDIDMTACPAETQSINFMVRSLTFDVLNFFEIELCQSDGTCSRLIESGKQAIDSAFAAAADWGQANGRPINVGEFGAYAAHGVAPLADRAAWTQLVRSAGQSHGFSMSYWEFGAGFGAYNRSTDTWIEPLVDALGVEAVVVAPSEHGETYIALNPSRILDTRNTVDGQYSSSWAAMMTRPVKVTGVGGVPSDGVTAVVLHVTTVNPTAPLTWLTISPAGEAAASTAVHNFGTASTTSEISNDEIVVKVGTGGIVDVRNEAGYVDLVIDVVGYYSADGYGYVPLAPSRILDSRNDSEGEYSSAWGASETREVTVTGGGGVPTVGVAAVAVHVTTAGPTAPFSWLTVSSPGEAANGTAVHNFGTASFTTEMVNDLIIAKVGASGTIDIRNHYGTVDLVIDVVGYFPTEGGFGYEPLNPTRILDSRNSTQGNYSTPWSDGLTRAVASTFGECADAVAVHVTTVGPTAQVSWLTVSPTGEEASTTAVNNFGKAAFTSGIVNDLMIVKLGTGGSFDIRNEFGNVDLVIDLVGVYGSDDCG